MITGDIIAFGSLILNTQFYIDWWHLCALNILGYVCTLIVEIADLHLEKTSFNYPVIRNEFNGFHKKHKNVIAHILTTFIGLVGLCGLFPIQKCLLFSATAIGYKYSIGNQELALVSALFVSLSSVVSTYFRLSSCHNTSLIIISISIQEMSHYIFSERTMMSEYWKKPIGTALKTWVYHTCWLVPLVLNTIF